MNSDTAIEVTNVCKTFKLKIHNPDCKKNIINQNPTKIKKNIVLDNVSFSVKKGEVVGIIGRNGCGKSTLLSMIAHIMEPDSGTIKISGKIASILELGMGLHQDMSGRENIYLKSELYGFSKKEIDKKIENIIDYSGIRKYIDNPVRTYSSGMSGRLAFSIMVNVDAEIMLIDEILSTGDIAFGKKSIVHFKKMMKSGKTVLIVSHNTSFIEECCSRTIWIENGKIKENGSSKTVCSKYRLAMSESPDIVKDLAEGGVADSQYALAIMYRDGKKIEKNYSEYVEWLFRAAEQGHVRAMVEYGDLLASDGKNTEALLYYKSAAEKNDEDAKNKVASFSSSDEHSNMLLKLFDKIINKNSGTDLHKYADLIMVTAKTNDDRKKAFKMYKEASELGSVQSYYQAALMCRDGIGTEKDLCEMEKLLLESSKHSHIPSIVMLANLYFDGKILPKNDELAFNFYQIAAKLGHTHSMYKIAEMYSRGNGIEKDNDKSREWYKKFHDSLLSSFCIWAADYIRNTNEDGAKPSDLYAIANSVTAYPSTLDTEIKIDATTRKETLNKLSFLAENENIDAIRRLANIYYDGVYVNRNYAQSFKLYSMGALMNDVWCIYRLGEMYRDGNGIKINIIESTKYFKKAGMMGHIFSLESIIKLYIVGLGKKEDVEFAINIMKKIALSGNDVAAFKLGNMYYNGIYFDINRHESIKWYLLAANYGNIWAMHRIGQMYKNGDGTDRNIDEAVRWLSISAENNMPAAADDIISISTTGFGDENIKKIGFYFLEKIAMTGNIDAMRRLGNHYYNGDGVKKNYHEAYRWYQLSARMGDEWCKLKLNNMCMNKITR